MDLSIHRTLCLAAVGLTRIAQSANHTGKNPARLVTPRGTMRCMGPTSRLTQTMLTERGFCGFVRFAELPNSEVPMVPGIYVLLRNLAR
ncbi:hypothetical protein StrepF001_23460 [Streptomyces sp. F001]|nr:hypothetical protein StrepF001_23460 [Streptomyces sp. F001]